MSTTIDQRVVEMKFDNSNFESNVKTSLSTLDKLKESLNLSGATKGLENIGDAAKNVNMNPLSDAVQTVHAKFSALEIIAITALTNITNSAVDAGKKLVSSLTVDQVTAGWDKYADKTSAVQTIMAATAKDFDDTGEQMEYVNSQLEKLNWFTDETSYNFLDMVNNIGKFTSNNIPLDKSVTAMQGISTWAAISGANTEEAGRAMYNLSQAMAVGAVKLQDWKSIENANMATAEFKQTAIDTAVAMGTLKKKADGTFETLKGNEVTVSNFNQALSDGWFSADVLMQTLDSYGSFSDELYKASEKTGKTATELLQNINDYKAGTLNLADIASDTGVSVSELTEMYENLSQETYNLGERSFRAAQEAKTFKEAIDATKDAVSTGWMTTFELIFGNYEEAKGLWTDLANAMYDVFAAGSEARNELLSGWKELGGRDVLIEAFWNAWEAAGKIINPIKEAFREIFPPKTAEQLYAITEKIRDLTEKFKISDETSQKLKNTFKGLFAIIDIVKQAFSAVWDTIKPLFSGFGILSGGILDATSSVGEWLVGLDESIKKNDTFRKAIQKVINFVKNAIQAFKDFAGVLKEKLHIPDLETIKESLKNFINTIKEKFAIPGFELFHSLLERIGERLSSVGETAGKVKDGIVHTFESLGEALANCKFLQVLQAIWNAVKTIVGGILSVLGDVASGLIEKLGNADFSGMIDILNGLSIGGIALAISNFLKSVSEPLSGLQGMLDGVTGILDGVRGCFEAYQTQLKAGTLLKIAAAIAILAASIVVISLIDSAKLAASLGAITTLFGELMASMAIFNKISGSSSNTNKAALTMIAMSLAVSILAGAMKKVAELDWDGVTRGLVGIAAMSAILVKSFNSLSSSQSKVLSVAAAMLVFSLAIKVLAGVCKDLSSLGWEQLAKGLVGVGALLAEVDIFLNTAKFSSKAMSTAIGMLVMSAAIKVLASACKDFSSMSWTEIGKGLTSIGVLLGELALFTNMTGDAKHVVSTGLSLVLIAASMKIFASAVSDFGSMSWETIGKGLLTMAVALAEVAIATNLMPKNMVSMGTGLLLVGAAMKVLASALSSLGGMSWEEIAKGLVAMGGALLELSIGLNVMNGTLAGSAAMLVAAAAIAVMAPALKLLGSMSWSSIAKGLVALAGAFTIMGVAGLVLAPIVGPILALSAAFALIGVGTLALGAGLLAIGAGLSAIAVGFSALASLGAAGATALVAALTVIIVGVADLIPTVVTKLGEGIIAFCEVLIASAPTICEAFVVVVTAVVAALVETIPLVVEAVVSLLTSTLTTLAEYMPTIVQAVFDILLACLQGIADNISLVVQTAIDIVLNFIDGIAQKIPDIIQSGFDLLLAFINGITDAINENTPLLVEAGQNLIWALINAAITILTGGIDLFKQIGSKIMNSGLVQGIKDKLSALKSTVTSAITGALQCIKNKFSSFLNAGKDLISKVITGIKNKISNIKQAVKDLINNAKDAITGKFSEWKDIGKNLIDGLINGVGEMASALWDKCTSVVSSAVDGIKSFLGINSPSKLFIEFGKFVDEGFMIGLDAYADRVADSSTNVGKGAVKSMSDAVSGISDILGDEIKEDPTIKPVMDLSEIQNGMHDIYEMMGKVDGHMISGSVKLADNTSRAIADTRERKQAIDESDKVELNKLVETIGSLSDEPSQKFENVFNIHGNNPKEIAEEVSKIIQHQVERKGASWA